MLTGKVKWFSDAKGYGFINAEGCPADIFVHYKVIDMPDRKTLVDGQTVEFEYEETDRGPHATKVIPKSLDEQAQ